MKDYEPKIKNCEDATEETHLEAERIKKNKTQGKQNDSKKTLNQNLSNFELKIPQGESNVTRCTNFMKTHFPFKKFCRWFYLKINKIEKSTVINGYLDEIEEYEDKIMERIQYIENDSDENALRFCGGAGVEEQSTLIQIAIDNAKKHGINLQPGVLNRADGNCTFDAVLIDRYG